jgi:hypothetical protein
MFGLVGVDGGTVAADPGSGASARALGNGAIGQIMIANAHAIRWAASVRGRPPHGHDDIMRNTPESRDMQRKTRPPLMMPRHATPRHAPQPGMAFSTARQGVELNGVGF